MNDYDLVDVYNENKEKTGKTKIRHKDEFEKGEYIVGVQATIINSKNEILISKRSENQKKFPLMWECNGGAILAGETSLQGILREVKEELGIVLNEDEAIFLKTVKKEKLFKDIYIFRKDVNIDDISFRDGEAVDAKLVTIDEYEKMYDNNEIVPNSDFRREDFRKVLEILKSLNK